MAKKPPKKKFSFLIIIDLFKALFRLTRMIYSERKMLVFLMFFLNVVIALAPLMQSGSSAFLINQLVSVAKGEAGMPQVYLGLTLLILAGIIFPLISSLLGYTDFIAWHILDMKFKFFTMEQKARLDVALHEDPEFGNLSHRAQEEMYRARNFVDRQYQIFSNIVALIASAVVIIVFKWWLFLIVFLATFPELIIATKFGSRMWGLAAADSEERRKFHTFENLFWPVRSLTDMKLFGVAGHFIERARKIFVEFQERRVVEEGKRIRLKVVSILISYGAIAFATAWFVFEVVNGGMQIGTFTFALASIIALRTNFSSLFYALAVQYEDGLFINDIFRFIDAKPIVVSPVPGISLTKNQTPDIIFENVTFAYPHTSAPVLKNFSLHIASGEKLALIGVNGAGKTTFVKLLCRFYDPQEGRILVNGVDLREINLESWYRHLGILFQDYEKYRVLNVSEAISLGDIDTPSSPQKVKSAARRSSANAFIEKWDNKYEQVLGKDFKDGVEPSIGQWQKLGLARVFYRDPNIFVLDEPTSSIDAESEMKIFEKLEKLSRKKSVILISHRFSTVRNADKIAVIEHGVLSEFGSHEELLKKKGTYSRLFRMQAKGYA